jgi:hypothetical protein
MFETKISGIPCLVKVVSTRCPQKTIRTGSGAGDCQPIEATDFEVEVFDRKGYKAEWLQRKLNTKQLQRIENEMNKACSSYGEY